MNGNKNDLLDYGGVAEYTNISQPVLRRYLHIARTNRETGDVTKSDIPEPDMTLGRSPAWYRHTIDEWLKGRPGKGVGGGPKPKH